MTPARRRLLSRFFAGVAVAATLFAAIVGYAEETVFDSEKFANRAVSVLDDESVKRQLGDAIAEGVLTGVPDAVAARPLIEGAAEALVGSRALQSLLATAVRDVHATVVKGNTDTVTVTLENVGVLIRSSLEAASPELAKAVSRGSDVEVISEGEEAAEAFVVDMTQFAESLRVGELIGILVALLAAAASIHFAPTRLAGIRRLGRSLAIGAIATVVAWFLVRALLVSRFDGDAADSARAVYDAFLVDLRTWLLILAGFGIVVTAGASRTRDPVDIEAVLARVWGWIDRLPQRTSMRIVRALLLIVVGVAMLQNQDTVLAIAVVLIGAFVVYVGSAELMRLAAGAVRADEETPSAARDSERDLGPGALARIVVVGAVLLGAFALIASASNEDEEPPLVVDTCNGHAELCDLRLNEVVLAGTHNSMSGATYPAWFFAQQERGITEQLEAGIRALLIDPHYGVETAAGVATDLDKDQGSREKAESGLGPEGVEAAEDIRSAIGYEGGGDTEVFLCHAFCEVGALRFERGLREIYDFLLANPGEVVVLSIEDATTPEDTVSAIEKAGLTDFVYDGTDSPLPTLREMVDSNQRLFVMAERDGGEPPWYREQFEITQETPFKFTDPAQLERPSSCDENRGPPDAPFFLMNHWVDTSPAPKPTNAKEVNRKGFILDRVAMCTRIRDTEPTIIAVDFYRQGDVLGAVDELNGVG